MRNFIKKTKTGLIISQKGNEIIVETEKEYFNRINPPQSNLPLYVAILSISYVIYLTAKLILI